MSRVYMPASDPGVATRTWGNALDSLIASKPDGSENRARLVRFSKEKVLKPLLKVILLETRSEQVLNALNAGRVSTNTFLRRLQNFCVGMNWLPWPVLPSKLWPRMKYRKKRAIKFEEHVKIIEREKNPERRAFYELFWHLGGSQSASCTWFLSCCLRPSLSAGPQLSQVHSAKQYDSQYDHTGITKTS